jgi:hypothetical protein
MTRLLTIVLAWASLGFMLTFAAGSFKNEPATAAYASANGLCEIDEAQVAPAAPQAYLRGPRIIQVPQTAALARVNNRDEPNATNDDDDDEVAAPAPRRRLAPSPLVKDNPPLRPRAPRWQPRSDVAPKPADPRRVVLSVPPPQAQGPTPIRPIPKLGAKSEPVEKFAQPGDTNAPPPADLQ